MSEFPKGNAEKGFNALKSIKGNSFAAFVKALPKLLSALPKGSAEKAFNALKKHKEKYWQRDNLKEGEGKRKTTKNADFPLPPVGFPSAHPFHTPPTPIPHF